MRLFSCCKRNRSNSEASSKFVAVECHFCGENQQVFLSDENRFFCASCQQYNGFAADGDYNVVRPELFIEELNPKPAPKGDFRLNSGVALCEKCQKKNDRWLLQDRELNWNLCPDCAFLVREAVAKNVLGAKTQYLAASVSLSGRAVVTSHSTSFMSAILRSFLVVVMLGCLGVMSLGLLSSSCWFYASDLVVALLSVLYFGVNSVLWSDDSSWHSYWMGGCCVVLLALSFVSLSHVLVRFVVCSVWVAVLSVIVLLLLRCLKDIRHNRLVATELKRMARPLTPVAPECEAGDADDDLPWQIGVPGKGWSSRKATFEFRPGDREPGSMVVGEKPPLPPTAEELAMESLFNSISIVSDGSDQVGTPIRSRLGEFWRDSPRMTLGSLAAAFACRVVFF
jgi:hypothetical protein